MLEFTPRWNCLLREVVVWDWPGSYLTRVHTLWGDTDKLQLAVPQAKCYGDGSLAWPRRFWALDPDWLAFADEDGLWQFDTRTRELLVIVRESAGGFEADGLAGVVLQDPLTLVLTFLDGRVWTVRAAQALCPEGRTSLRGGGCDIECRLAASDGSRMHWVSEVSGDCLPCTMQLACGLGEELVPCSAWRDAYCRRCEFALDPACLACPGETTTAQAKPCVRCDITTVSVDASARVYTDVGEGLVIRYTSSGTIWVSADVRATVLVVGGGGNGGGLTGGGGGGAGTVIFAENVTTIRGGTTLAVTVGGAGQSSSLEAGFVASGGGNGGRAYMTSGGSGGGMGGTSTVFGVSGIYTGPNVFANAGAGGGMPYYYYGGAGGGAGGAGSPGQCGAGGAGLSSVNILGKVSVFSNVFGQAYTSVAVNGAVAGGGTGSMCCGGWGCGSNGLGGFGSTGGSTNGGNGVPNTGSGGGGTYSGTAGTGGSGLVLIKIHPWYGGMAQAQQPSSCVCTARSDSVYVSAGTCDASTMRPIPPCAAGWYAASDAGVSTGYCVKCPAYTASLYAGATMLDQCKCVHGMTRRAGRCVGEALYEFDGPGGAGDALLCAGEACKVPPNAVRYAGDGIACRWYCNAGYYRDTRAGFLSQCRRCLVGMGSNRTRGDDDSPWSCE